MTAATMTTAAGIKIHPQTGISNSFPSFGWYPSVVYVNVNL
jgi:hypothetical protein